MSTIISILIIIVCILLVLVVLVQNSKGGGLASSFSSSNQVMGVRKTGDFLEKATWTLAVSLMVLCIMSASFNSTTTTTTNESTSATRKMAEENGVTNTAPAPAAPAIDANKPTAPAPSQEPVQEPAK